MSQASRIRTSQSHRASASPYTQSTSRATGASTSGSQSNRARPPARPLLPSSSPDRRLPSPVHLFRDRAGLFPLPASPERLPDTDVNDVINRYDISDEHRDALSEIFTSERSLRECLVGVACLQTQMLESFEMQLNSYFQNQPRVPTPNADEPAHPTQDSMDPAIERRWHGGKLLRRQVRTWAKENFRDSNIQSYTLTHDDQQQPISRALDTVILKLLQSQDRDFHRKYLPKGFATDEEEAVMWVTKMIRDITKQVRERNQKIFLTGIKNRNPDETIPPMSHIYGHIMRGTKSLLNIVKTETNWARLSKHLKTRFSFIRLEGLNIYRDPLQTNPLWKTVDNRLIWIRTLPRPAQQKFNAAIEAAEKKIAGLTFGEAVADPSLNIEMLCTSIDSEEADAPGELVEAS